MKRWKWITAALIMPLVTVVTVMAAGPGHAPYRAGSQIIDNTTYFDKNSLLMFVTNTGSIAYDKTTMFGKADGLYYPRGTNKSVIYAGGVWMGAKVNGETRVFVSEYSNECVPGPMKDGSYQPDQGRFRVYKINSGDSRASNPDYANWPFQDGAPAALDANGDPVLDKDGNMIPKLQGDQALWAVYNDADISAHNNVSGSSAPLGVEVQQYVFGYARSGALGTTIFVRYIIINKGGNQLNDTYIAVWADPDLGDAGDDFVGCDTALSLGFCYNDGPDATYGDAPPAVGYDFFQGPIVPGDAGDSAWISGRGIYVHGYKNLPMSSFNKYINGTDPKLAQQTYNYMQGLSPGGDPQTDPNTGQATTYVVAGDPVAGTGWLDDASDDRRYMMSSGPFNMAPGDTQEVVIAVLVGQGADRLASVTDLKRRDRIAQTVFDLNFDIPGPPPLPSLWGVPNEGAVQLIWGQEADGNVQYGLGPVNPETDAPDTLQTFVMEGLNIYQGASSSGPWTKIATYDENNGVQRIYSDLDATEGVERLVVQRGTDSGLEHDMWVTQDRVNSGGLIDNRPYYFTVTAYNYDAQNTREFYIGQSEDSYGIISESFENLPGSNAIEMVPRSLTGILADTVAAAPRHIGGSDGEVILDYIDPNLITGDEYEVTFVEHCDTTYDAEIEEDVITCGFLWNLDRVTGDSRTRIFENQSTPYGSEPVDGFLIRVIGPPPGMKDWDYAGPTARWFSGYDWGGRFFFGGIDDGDLFFGSNITAADYRTIELRFSTTDTQNGYRYLRGGSPSYGYVGYDPVPFTAWDVDADPPRQVNVAFVENNGFADGQWLPHEAGNADYREYLFILNSDYDEAPDPYYTSRNMSSQAGEFDVLYAWWPQWRTDHTSAELADGQIFTLIANHANTPADTFHFSTTIPGTVNEGTVISESVQNVHPVPNPYYNVSPLELDQFRRQLKFVNLPAAKTTIRIFNLAGDLVRTLVKDDPGAAEITWDILTENGLPLASGLYIYHVEAEGLGTKVGKVAVFTEVEQVEQF